jgi:23S rRNA (uridine2552-2'-O)-methyltransferase
MYERKDAWWARAKREGYRSRAAYKLLELQRRARILRRGDAVIDLGAWPGGWLQAAADIIGPSGRVLGVDLVRIDPLPSPTIVLLEADVAEPTLPERTLEILGRPADVVLSDLAPKLTGVAPRDAARQAELAERALAIAGATLRVGGSLVMKTFGGAATEHTRRELAAAYASVRLVHLDATRRGSSELYLIGRSRRQL